MTLHGKEIIPIASNHFSGDIVKETTSDACHTASKGSSSEKENVATLPEAEVKDIPSSGAQGDSDTAKGGAASNSSASNITPSDKLCSMIRQQLSSAISLLSPSESFTDICG